MNCNANPLTLIILVQLEKTKTKKGVKCMQKKKPCLKLT